MMIRAVSYTKTKSTMVKNPSEEALANMLAKPGVLWVDMQASEVSDLRALKHVFGFHELSLEDTVTRQNPKIEDHDNYIFLLLKDIHHEKTTRASQISFFIGRDFVVTVRSAPCPYFEPVVDGIVKQESKILSKNPAFLAHHLMDAVVDNYFTVLGGMEESIEDVEANAIKDASKEMLLKISRLKRQFLVMRRSVWPAREVLNSLRNGEMALIPKSSLPYYRDLHDSVSRAADLIETNREIVTDAMSVHLSAMSNAMNEVMKVLTIIATIMMPLTLISGIYGMNFKNMPEIYWTNGYYFSLGLMFFIAVVMLAYFRKKKWI